MWKGTRWGQTPDNHCPRKGLPERYCDPKHIQFPVSATPLIASIRKLKMLLRTYLKAPQLAFYTDNKLQGTLPRESPKGKGMGGRTPAGRPGLWTSICMVSLMDCHKAPHFQNSKKQDTVGHSLQDSTLFIYQEHIAHILLIWSILLLSKNNNRRQLNSGTFRRL